MEKWNLTKSNDLYRVQAWGDGYFDVNENGNVCVKPNKNGKSFDLFELTRSLVQRGIEAPILFRFDGIIKNRVQYLQDSFAQAILSFGYTGKYRAAFPIKVNQQKHVVDIVRQAGREFMLGLEVGSKPELLAVLAIHDTPNALLLCNGYKDAEYIELALLSGRIGRRPVIIIEQLYELQAVLDTSARLGVDAEIGLRMKPSSKGSGRWESSGGDQAKFGLSTHEIVLAINQLKKAQKTDCLKLLHFHIGSQITAINSIKRVLREATRMYTEIAKLCPSLCFFDVGGGLGVDYDGSRTNFESSMNYTVEEYARDVVSAIQEACNEAALPHPDIVTECGRALLAHHAVLISEVIDVAPSMGAVQDLEDPPSDNQILSDLRNLYRQLSVKNCHETLHDALEIKETILQGFIQGSLSLEDRAYADKGYKHLIAKLKVVSEDLKFVPEDLQKLDEGLRDTFFCNFSVFQSLPDSWAIDQLFPIMPIHRLCEEPKRKAIMADLTCDSDGKIDRFIDLKDVGRHITLHELTTGSPYYLGIFLIGAYQETLGDLHNLFGDTNAVHIEIDENGQPDVTHIVEGDTVREVLGYVQYEAQDLMERLRTSLEKALKAGTLTHEQSATIQKRYKESLEGYTYLVV
ncbi:MAG: biosynthetic arginine decarboxylase [bacterium]|nr:biosynthetic arginine decarboxylase [bacterium]